jgi:hypothetical protein
MELVTVTDISSPAAYESFWITSETCRQKAGTGKHNISSTDNTPAEQLFLRPVRNINLRIMLVILA